MPRVYTVRGNRASALSKASGTSLMVLLLGNLMNTQPHLNTTGKRWIRPKSFAINLRLCENGLSECDGERARKWNEICQRMLERESEIRTQVISVLSLFSVFAFASYSPIGRQHFCGYFYRTKIPTKFQGIISASVGVAHRFYSCSCFPSASYWTLALASFRYLSPGLGVLWTKAFAWTLEIMRISARRARANPLVLYIYMTSWVTTASISNGYLGIIFAKQLYRLGFYWVMDESAFSKDRDR